MFFVYRQGAYQPTGPFDSEAKARRYTEGEARAFPGKLVWLLSPISRVLVPASEPMWDEGPVRPLAPVSGGGS